MQNAISFETKQFDLDKEEENPIAPIGGKSVVEWMSNLHKSDGIGVCEMDAVDLGCYWFSNATYHVNKYSVGFIDFPAEPKDGAAERLVRVDKSHTLFKSIHGQSILTNNDPFLSIAKGHVKEIQVIVNIEVTQNTGLGSQPPIVQARLRSSTATWFRAG